MRIKLSNEHWKASKQIEDASKNAYYIIPNNIPDWAEVRVIYPSVNAAARVVFHHKSTGKRLLSTYLDTIDYLDYVGEPYFELYPDEENDCSRYVLTEQDMMWGHILKLLNDRKDSTDEH